ncbi:MAG: hypothetical protein J6H19_05505 [Bacteroidaceae bacterium]|nr:hypothetical protein [Bacteroidaceae bacterium]
MNDAKSAQKLVRLSRFVRFGEPSLIRARWQSFCFYIKPQLAVGTNDCNFIVSSSVSTKMQEHI